MPTQNWRESDHPRARTGQFAKTAGGGDIHVHVHAGRRTPAEEAPKDIHGAKRELLKSIKASRGPVLTAKLASRTGIERSLLASALKELQDSGQVHQTGQGWSHGPKPGGGPPQPPQTPPQTPGKPVWKKPGETPPASPPPASETVTPATLWDLETAIQHRASEIESIFGGERESFSEREPLPGSVGAKLIEEQSVYLAKATDRLHRARNDIRMLPRSEFAKKYRGSFTMDDRQAHAPSDKQAVKDVDDTCRLIWAALPDSVRKIVTKNRPLQVETTAHLSFDGAGGEKLEALGLHWSYRSGEGVFVRKGKRVYEPGKTYSWIQMATQESSPWGKRRTKGHDKTFVHEVGHGVDHNMDNQGRRMLESTYRTEYEEARKVWTKMNQSGTATLAKYHMSSATEAFAESFAVLFNPIQQDENSRSYFWGLTRKEAMRVFPLTIAKVRDTCRSMGIKMRDAAKRRDDAGEGERMPDGFRAHFDLDGNFHLDRVRNGTVYPLEPEPEDHLRIAPGIYDLQGKLVQSLPR